MIFRTVNGELVEIIRYNYKNDKLYYEKILEIKKQFISKIELSKQDYLTKFKINF